MNNFEINQQKESIFRKAEIFDIPIILKLLRENLDKNLSEEEKKEGMLYYEPTEEDMAKIINDTGIYIILNGQELKGYLMTMSKELAQNIPFEAELLINADKMIYEDRPIGDYKYAVFAQICIAKQYRRGTTFHKLHSMTQTAIKDLDYELGIGEIFDGNKNSLAVHSNFTDAGTYISSSGLKWHVVVIDLRED